MSEPLVSNAGDKKQVRNAKQREKRDSEQFSLDMNAVLKSPAGRAVLWRMLEHCGAFKSVWSPSALIHYNSGKQDVGHWLLAEINDADPDALFYLMKENRKK